MRYKSVNLSLSSTKAADLWSARNICIVVIQVSVEGIQQPVRGHPHGCVLTTLSGHSCHLYRLLEVHANPGTGVPYPWNPAS